MAIIWDVQRNIRDKPEAVGDIALQRHLHSAERTTGLTAGTTWPLAAEAETTAIDYYYY